MMRRVWRGCLLTWPHSLATASHRILDALTSELKSYDSMYSCPVHTSLEESDPDHMWVEKKTQQKKNRDSWGFTVNVAGDKGHHSHGLSKIRRKGPKDREWEALTLKGEASTSQSSMGKETHWISWMCVWATNAQREQSGALEIPLLRQNGYFVSINQ